jgi:hypothetical protein
MVNVQADPGCARDEPLTKLPVGIIEEVTRVAASDGIAADVGDLSEPGHAGRTGFGHRSSLRRFFQAIIPNVPG